ncbi:MAG TPA: TonB-dependent receptor [Terriglobia bacterium]|nr:TonB-dependent receptor [Terriglobia bacterium]
MSRRRAALVTLGAAVALAAGLLCGAAPLRAAAHGALPQVLRLAGTVRDSSGAPIPNAQVTLTSGTLRAQTRTDGEGNFSFELANRAARSGTVTVEAPGFGAATGAWSAPEPEAGRLDFTLRPASVSERVTVTATRTATRLDQTAADVSVLTSQDLASTSALKLDDALRQIPGFSLFRRSGSRTSNPTSQGVSLRGVGASGSSRALVLEDGIPLNDPFGGWVYWDRVPRPAVASVEVVEGGSSDLYGSDALGGVINVRTRPPDLSHLDLEFSYGNEKTPDLALDSSLALGRWALGISTEAFHTDGYVLVPSDIRGPIDDRAGVDYRSGAVTLERGLSGRGRVFVRGDYLGEVRQNGKVNEGNHTIIRQLAAGADWPSSRAGSFSMRAYAGTEGLDQNFYAVGAGRATETLTDDQRVPVQDLGFSAQWTRSAGSFQTLVAGFETSGVRGASNDFKFTGGSLEPTSAVGAGGRQQTFAVFGEDIFRFGSKWVVTLGARLDDWLNYRALSVTQPLSKPGPATVTVFPDRSEQALSPRLSVLRRVSANWSLTGSVYRAFRAPSLNELYRSFRLGSVLTLANDELQAERLTGAEAGATWVSSGRGTTARATLFWADITRPIENVTLSTTPSLTTRQRQNLGRTRSRGISLDLAQTVTRTLSLNAGYQFTGATVVSFPVETALVGLRIPEVPRHEATLQVRYSNPGAANRWARFTLGVQGRAESAAYDDDLNTLRLTPYFTLDATASEPLAPGVELFAAGENLTGQRYEVALTPAANLGPPVLFRAGVRFNLGRR